MILCQSQLRYKDDLHDTERAESQAKFQSFLMYLAEIICHFTLPTTCRLLCLCRLCGTRLVPCNEYTANHGSGLTDGV